MKKLSSIRWALLMMCCVGISSCKDAPKMAGGAKSEYKVLEIALTNKLLTNNYSATINGRQNVEIRPQVSGMITEVCIEEGAAVKKGQTLFVIDQVPYKAALQTAQANVASAAASVATAELAYNSKQELFKQNVVSQYDLQMAKNTLLVQQATLAQMNAQEINAKNNLSYTVVKSPVNGVAGMISYRVGSLVSSSIATPLVTVSDDEEVYVYFSMTENQVLDLTRTKGTTAEVIKSMTDVELRLSDGLVYGEKGKIDAISGMVDQTTGSVRVRATFPNESRMLRSGASGNLIVPYQKENCIVIPQAATFEIQDKLFVYKVIDGKAVSSQIKVFTVNDGREYVVESGLQAGDKIVAEGVGLLREGTEITGK